MHYIQALLRDLRDLGYHQLALSVVAMQQLIADLIIDDAELKKLVHLRYVCLLQFTYISWLYQPTEKYLKNDILREYGRFVTSRFAT